MFRCKFPGTESSHGGCNHAGRIGIKPRGPWTIENRRKRRTGNYRVPPHVRERTCVAGVCVANGHGAGSFAGSRPCNVSHVFTCKNVYRACEGALGPSQQRILLCRWVRRPLENVRASSRNAGQVGRRGTPVAVPGNEISRRRG